MKRTLGMGLLVLAAGCGGDPPKEDTTDWTIKASGLKYVDLQEGKGRPVEAGETVRVDYTGWLAQGGTVFDSSKNRGPFTFRLGFGKVIQGWDEGVAGMKPGGRRKLYIPAKLAYGEVARGKIPANSDLIFDVQLLDVVAIPPEEDDQ